MDRNFPTFAAGLADNVQIFTNIVVFLKNIMQFILYYLVIILINFKITKCL